MEINVSFLQANTLSDFYNESNAAVFFRRSVSEAIDLNCGTLTATKKEKGEITARFGFFIDLIEQRFLSSIAYEIL